MTTKYRADVMEHNSFLFLHILLPCINTNYTFWCQYITWEFCKFQRSAWWIYIFTYNLQFICKPKPPINTSCKQVYFVIICSICSLQSLNNALGQNEQIKMTRYKACPSESSYCLHYVNLKHMLVFVDCQSNSTLLEAKTWKMRAISAFVGNCIHALTYT